MAYQTAQDITVSYKVQGAKGTPATGASGKKLRYIPSQGLRLAHAIVDSDEVRDDGQTTRGGHGTAVIPPTTYGAELSNGTLDEIFEAFLRSTFVAATDITEATAGLTSITTTTFEIVAGAGSWLTAGVRRGQKIKIAGHSTAGNNGKYLRVLGVTASTITLPAGSLTLNATPDTAFTITIAKSLISGAAPVERYFTIDEHNKVLDISYVGSDIKFNKLTIKTDPDKNIVCTIGLIGLDVTTASAGSAPTLTGPVATTTLPMRMKDGVIRIGGVDYADLMGFEFTWDLGGSTPSTLGPRAADTFLDNAKLSGSFSAIRTGVVFFDAAKAETQIDIFVDCREPETDPTDFCAFYIGNAVIDDASGSIGGKGPLIDACPFRAGKDEGGGDRAATTVMFSTSAT